MVKGFQKFLCSHFTVHQDRRADQDWDGNLKNSQLCISLLCLWACERGLSSLQHARPLRDSREKDHLWADKAPSYCQNEAIDHEATRSLELWSHNLYFASGIYARARIKTQEVARWVPQKANHPGDCWDRERKVKKYKWRRSHANRTVDQLSECLGGRGG